MDHAFATSIIISIISIEILSKVVADNVANSSSSIELKALMEFGWPRTHSTTHHCEWNGITCDDAGRVAELSLQRCYTGEFYDLKHLDVLAFPCLSRIHLSSCNLNGKIPPQIGYLSKLTYLNLSHNQINSELPLSLTKLTELRVLDISGNHKIHGIIPPKIRRLSKLTHLILSHNDRDKYSISGAIPREIGYLEHLVVLDLSNNNINGSLPPTMSRLTKLEIIKLDGNSLEGVFGVGIEKLPSIKMIDLRWNSISGEIPPRFGHGRNSPFLNIDLSWNKLSGRVPGSLVYLDGINLTHNHLEGHIPSGVWRKFKRESFLGNPELLPPKDPNIVYRVAVVFIGCFMVCSCFFGILFTFCIRGNESSASVTPDPKHGDVLKIWNYDGNIAYQHIIEATEDFDIRYCIGTGGYGSVYRAHLPTGKVVAVKKLHRFETENPSYDLSFRNEAEFLSKIRHRHIVKLFGFCLHKRSMFLIYDYMERGSLFTVLKYDDEAAELNWVKRVNVVKAIANALSYMHHDCSPPILHRDISSSNILLDSNFEACISDFGTARLLDPDSSNQTLLVGTRGYIAPCWYHMQIHTI